MEMNKGLKIKLKRPTGTYNPGPPLEVNGEEVPARLRRSKCQSRDNALADATSDQTVAPSHRFSPPKHGT